MQGSGDHGKMRYLPFIRSLGFHPGPADCIATSDPSKDRRLCRVSFQPLHLLSKVKNYGHALSGESFEQDLI